MSTEAVAVSQSRISAVRLWIPVRLVAFLCSRRFVD